MSDTIVALATPLGRSGIGVIRISGSRSLEYAASLCGDTAFSPEPRRSLVKTLIDPESREEIDEAVLTYFKSPYSFTGEDVVEISCHGSPVLLRSVLDLLLALGARMAEPGEFTLRALGSGRIDLSQAEAIRDLIDARSTAAARQSIRQLRGTLSNELKPIKDRLVDSIVVLESALEFVEDDLPDLQADHIRSQLINSANEIRSLAETFKAGRLLREGLKVILAGRPNVGKSSLFNALLGRDRSIVTDIAGTTRDQINEQLIIENIPILLMDTAGIRDTNDVVESIGVERSRMAMADADLAVVIVDASEPLSYEDEQILNGSEDIHRIVVLNKVDKTSNAAVDALHQQIAVTTGKPDEKRITISAKFGTGLEDLKKAIIGPFLDAPTENMGFLITDARHHDLLNRAEDDIVSSIDLLNERVSEEMVLVGLHNALKYLGEITGETTTEDILTRIFSTFCIGK